MRLRRLLAAAASSSLLSTSVASADPPATSTPDGRPLLDGVAYRGLGAYSISSVAVFGKRVAVRGPFVEIDTSSASPTRIDLPIEHVDQGAHEFQLEVPGLVQGGFQCNARDLKITIAFQGYARFSARVTKAGKTKELVGQEKELLLPGFDTAHGGATEMFTLRLVIGMVRPNVPTLVVEHEDQKILLTPEPIQPVTAPPALPKVFRLRTRGLPAFTLVEPSFQFAVAPPKAAGAVGGLPPAAAPATPSSPARNATPAPAARNAAPVPEAGRNGVPGP